MPVNPTDVFLAERIRVIGEPDHNPLARNNRYIEIVVRLLRGLNVGNGQSSVSSDKLFDPFLHRIVFEYHDMTDKIAFLLAKRLDFIKRERIVSARGKCLLLGFSQDICHRLSRFAPNPDRNRIDKQADHAFHTGDIRRTARNDAAEHDIPAVVINLQNKTPERLDERTQRHLILPGHALDPLAQFPAEFKIQFDRVETFRFTLRFFLRKLRVMVVAVQVTAPIVGCRVPILFLQPFDITGKRSNGRKFRFSSFQKREIAFKHFLDHEGHAPAVHQDMMVAPDQVPGLFIGPHKGHPHKRVMRQIKFPGFVGVCQFSECLLPLRLVKSAYICVVNFAFPLTKHDLNRLIFPSAYKIGPKRFMPLNQHIQPFRKSFGVEAALQIERDLLEIGFRIGVQQAVEQHALLHRSQRVHIFQLADGGGACRQLLQLFYGQLRQQDIARRKLRQILGQAVRDYSPQACFQEAPQPLNRLPAVLCRAVADRKLKRTLRDHSVHVEREIHHRVSADIVPG